MNENNLIYSKVYMWMFIGLLITFLTGYCLSLNPVLMYEIIGVGLIPIIIIELAVAFFFAARLEKMNPITAKICFLLYSFVTGLTFSVLFELFEMMSIIMVFGVTSLLFLIFAVYGYYTKKDLTKIGPILFMGLLGIIITSIMNFFIKSSQLDFIVTIIGIVIFLGYVAYDMKKIRILVEHVGEEKGAVYGAFQLYLDFINLFIRLLKILGKSRD